MLLAGCILGGTGTDTPNGITTNDSAGGFSGFTARVVDSSGLPVPGVTLAVFDTGFRPDAGKAQIPLTYNADKALVTDAKGQADIALRAGGVYVLEGSRGDETVLFDTLRIGNPQAAATISFAVRRVKAYKGRVKLASGMHVDSGAVFIRGTRRWARVDADGGYDLGTLPVDAVRMAIGMRYAATPTSVRQINQTVVKTETTLVDSNHVPMTVLKDTVKYTCKDVTNDTTLKRMDTAIATRPDSTSIDSGKVSAALKACDSLPAGTLVNVKVVNPAGATKDSVSAGYLVITRKNPDPAFNTISYTVSYTQCLDGSGGEQTTFALTFEDTAQGSDLAVGDLAPKCVKP